MNIHILLTMALAFPHAAHFFALPRVPSWPHLHRLGCQHRFGQFMLSPIAVQETGLGTFSPDTALTNLINQSGLNVPFVSGSTDFDSYFAPPNSNFSKNRDGTKWVSLVSFDLPFGGTLDFDLGDTYLVSKVAICKRERQPC